MRRIKFKLVELDETKNSTCTCWINPALHCLSSSNMRLKNASFSSSLILLDGLSTTSDKTGSSGCNKTALLTSWCVSSDGSWMSNMLMITTTMGMFNWVHCNTSNSWPVISLSTCLEPGVSGLEEGLIGSLSTSADANHGSANALDALSGSGWESNSGLPAVVGVTDDNSWCAWGSGESSSVSEFTFTVWDDGTLWHLIHWKNISNGERCFCAGIDELACVHSFDSDEVLNSLLVSVCISEGNLREWGTSAWVMNDVLHNTLHIPLSLNEVQGSEPGWSDSVSAARLENKTTSVSLCYIDKFRLVYSNCCCRRRVKWYQYLPLMHLPIFNENTA